MNILGNIWWKRKHHNKGCKGNGLRCICGDIFGGGSSSKNADEATQQIEGIGNAVQQESALTPQATQQWQGSYNIGQYLQNLFGQEVGMPNATAPTAPTAEQQYQAQGPVSQALYQNVLNQAQNPTAGWQNALAPQLTQAQNTINEYYNARGLDNSGIAIGGMGEAGVDLAIQNAQNEMTYQQQSLQNAQALSQNAGLVGQQNVQNLSGLYGQQQGYGLQGQQLAQQGYQAGAGYQAYPSQAALGNYYGQQAANQAFPGQILGAGAQLGSAMMMGNALAGAGSAGAGMAGMGAAMDVGAVGASGAATMAEFAPLALA